MTATVALSRLIREKKETVLEERKLGREKIYNRLRRCFEPDVIEVLKSERDALTCEIAEIRKQIRLAEAVLNRVPSMKGSICEEQQLQAQMRDETGRFYRERDEKKREIRSRGWGR